ncbi:MAG: hypothetical protein N2595_09615, partial [bacterium]|nr:hypothetical protein [bacterium]
SLPWAPLRIHWGVVGSGTQVAKTKGVQGPIAGHIGYAKATRQLNEYRRQLTDVAAQHWHGEATVTAITPTSVTVTLPVPSWEWLSAGVPVRITNIALGYNTDAQVVSTTAPNTADISASGYPGSIGDTVRFSIQLKLKTQPSEYIWV